jgi:hypothetical protein
MKIMASNSSATAHQDTPHTNNSTTNIINEALKRRARAVIEDKSIDADARAVIRYSLEIDDPWLADLVRRVDAGETIIDELGFLQISTNEVSAEEKIEALTEMICRASDESAAALLVFMSMLEDAPHPKALANAVKHVAFTHCGRLNLYGIVDAQIALLESELLSSNKLAA